MNTLKFILLTFIFVVFNFFSFGQVKTSIEIAPGVLVDSVVGYGANVNGNYYFKDLPISLGLGIGYYKNEQRSGIEFDYSYFSKSGLISNLSLNYLVINNSEGFNLDLSSRLVHLSSSRENYSSNYDSEKMKLVVNSNKLNSSNYGFGVSTVLKYRFVNGCAVAAHLGVDYLFGRRHRLIQTANIGFEIPLTRWNQSSLYKPKLIEGKKKASKAPEVDKTTSTKVTPKNVDKTPSIKPVKTVSDTIKKQIVQEKTIITKKDTVSTVKNQNKEVIEPKNEQPKIKSEPIQEPKINKQIEAAQKTKATVENKKENAAKQKKTPAVTSKPKLQGPLNILGNQYELGDDWNYWKGNNELWYAKHKDKEKWYDLIQSLSDENYNKAKQILIKDAKKVE